MNILTDEITTQIGTTAPEAALKIEVNENLARYLFFQTVTDDSISFQSQITDNWVENNTAIQDHIALSPVTITMRGLIGECIYTSEDAQKDYERALAQANFINSKPLILAQFGNYYTQTDLGGKLTAISAYFPEVSNITQRAQSVWDLREAASQKAQRIANTLTQRTNQDLSSKMDAYSGLSTNARQSRLKEIGEMLKDFWMSRKSFIANTPFGDFDNMYIDSVSMHQGNENFIGEINITLKQIRFANTLTTKADEKVLAKYNAYAQAQEQNNGKAQGNTSIVKEATDRFSITQPGSGIRR